MIIPARLNRFYVESEIVPVTRLWDAEIPTGDPFGGAAFGEKNKKVVKSVVNVVKKVAPIALGIAATIATGGAFAAALAAGGGFAALAAGVAFAGSALSLTGTVTGNEKLTKIGSVLGLAGGVGMIGNNIANAAAGGAGFSDSVVKGLEDTVSQLKAGSEKAWGALTGSPVGGVPVDGATLGQTPVNSAAPLSDAVGGLDGIAGDYGSGFSNSVSGGLDGVAGDLGANYAGSSNYIDVAGAGLDGPAGDIAPRGLIAKNMSAAAPQAATSSKGLISQTWDMAKGVGKFVADKDNAGVVLLGGNILSSVVPSAKDDAEEQLARARAQQIQDEMQGRERYNSSINRQYQMQINPNARVFNPGAKYTPGQTSAYRQGQK